MMIGEAETKEAFKYLSRHGIRAIAAVFISKEAILNQLVDSIPENVLTGFHLKDIFDATNKPAEIKQKLYDAIMFNKRFPKSLAVSKQITKEQPDQEEEKKKLEIDFDLTKFFKDHELLDCINKLQKADLNDPELFFKVDVGTLEGILDIKPEGKKHKMMKKIKELREKFEKEGTILYIDPGLLEDIQAPSLQIVRSHTFAKKPKVSDF